MNKQIRTEKLILEWDNSPGEFYMLKGLLLACLANEKVAKQFDTKIIAERMDYLNGSPASVI